MIFIIIIIPWNSTNIRLRSIERVSNQTHMPIVFKIIWFLKSICPVLAIDITTLYWGFVHNKGGNICTFIRQKFMTKLNILCIDVRQWISSGCLKHLKSRRKLNFYGHRNTDHCKSSQNIAFYLPSNSYCFFCHIYNHLLCLGLGQCVSVYLD